MMVLKPLGTEAFEAVVQRETPILPKEPLIDKIFDLLL